MGRVVLGSPCGPRPGVFLIGPQTSRRRRGSPGQSLRNPRCDVGDQRSHNEPGDPRQEIEDLLLFFFNRCFPDRAPVGLTSRYLTDIRLRPTDKQDHRHSPPCQNDSRYEICGECSQASCPQRGRIDGRRFGTRRQLTECLFPVDFATHGTGLPDDDAVDSWEPASEFQQEGMVARRERAFVNNHTLFVVAELPPRFLRQPVNRYIPPAAEAPSKDSHVGSVERIADGSVFPVLRRVQGATEVLGNGEVLRPQAGVREQGICVVDGDGDKPGEYALVAMPVDRDDAELVVVVLGRDMVVGLEPAGRPAFDRGPARRSERAVLQLPVVQPGTPVSRA